ncbi:MAG: thiamine phosphate synthase [Chloroflexi bacterium]|nr:thiamine phosphate synthase [Chloroflexota bacterium]
MIIGDMYQKREAGRKKVLEAIKLHGGTTLLSTGISGDDARMALAAVQAGAKLIEPNHPATALARGHKGVTNMHDAENVRHEITLLQMAEVISGVRNVVGPDIYITAGVPGTFAEVVPTPLIDEDMALLSRSGADGLHTHKSTIEDLKAVVDLGHKNGLLIDAYIASPSDRHLFGIPADKPADVAETAKKMQDIGVDFVGLMTGMSYEGAKAGEIAPPVKERLEAMLKAVTVPTIAEGGINADNFKAFIGTGVNIIVVGTAIDDMAKEAVRKAVKTFLNQ